MVLQNGYRLNADNIWGVHMDRLDENKRHYYNT